MWVEVRDQLGVWRTYDPALKRHLWADGAGAQPSLVSGGATGFVNRARQGMQSGTLNGRAWVTSLNVASVQSDLVAAASTLDGWIASDAQRANASSMELWGATRSAMNRSLRQQPLPSLCCCHPSLDWRRAECVAIKAHD